VKSHIPSPKTLFALLLFLAANAFAASLPYSDADKENPQPALTSLQSEWADYLVRQQISSSGMRRHDLEGFWAPKVTGRGRDSDGSETAATTFGNEAASNSSSQWASWGEDAQGQNGDSWEGLRAGWPDGGPWANDSVASFHGLQTLLNDAPLCVIPLSAAPEPRAVVFLLAGLLASALSFARRFGLQR